MKLRMIDWLKCPACFGELSLRDAHALPANPSEEASPPSECRSCRVSQSRPHGRRGVQKEDCAACYQLEVDGGWLVCSRGHAYPIINGVPTLTVESRRSELQRVTGSDTADDSIRASFSSEWSHFEYDDRTWAWNVDERAELFLKEMNCRPKELRGKILLDAGCGNGSLSRALNRFGCEVLAADISDAVDRAHQHFAAQGNGRTHFVKATLTQHPFQESSVDFIYSSGALHHNPDTRAAFVALLKALKPGGKIYVWVYHRIPGLRHALKQFLRGCVVALPHPIKHAFVRLWLPQAMLRQYLRTALRRNTPQDRLRWRERLILLMDHYTPRHRWEHTQEELHAWYRASGLVDIATTEVREWGFGVVGRKPATDPIETKNTDGVGACAE